MIKYPNGSSPHSSTNPLSHFNRPINYSKRGMSLEDTINEANIFYLQRNIAVIHKKSTPINIVNVDYPKRSAAKITEAYFAQASTTDYNGIYRGFYIDFDAKETQNKTAIPLANFHEHQIKHLEAITAQNGIGFVIIKFTPLDEVYLLPASNLIRLWYASKIGARKSIPYTYIKEYGFRIFNNLMPQLPYLQAVDEMLTKDKSYK